MRDVGEHQRSIFERYERVIGRRAMVPEYHAMTAFLFPSISQKWGSLLFGTYPRLSMSKVVMQNY